MHPWYTDKDVVFEPALLGSWFDPTEKDTQAAFIFEKGGPNSYKVTFVNFSETQHLDLVFDAHLMGLDGKLFIDAVQKSAKVRGEDVDIGIVVPGHLVGRISIQGDVLQMKLLDDDWVKKGIEAGTISIEHENVDGVPVLTASTPELQKFLLAHADDDQAFSSKADNLHRRK
ncbi:MAG: hypothetical protein WAN23_04715 [Candidatus Acidiferrales bacterium]